MRIIMISGYFLADDGRILGGQDCGDRWFPGEAVSNRLYCRRRPRPWKRASSPTRLGRAAPYTPSRSRTGLMSPTVVYRNLLMISLSSANVRCGAALALFGSLEGSRLIR
jgi:hypothetical protein